MNKHLVTILIAMTMITGCAPATEKPPLSQPPTNTPNSVTEYIPAHPKLSLDSLQPGQTPYAFLSSSGEEVRYLLFLPDNYGNTVEWPIIVFLHGTGGIGMDINLILNKTLPNYVEDLPDFPFIVVSPQLKNGLWPKMIDPIDELLDHLIDKLQVDVDHLYLTGLSAGGYGTWKYALKYPDRFAAIAPIAGGTSTTTDPVPEDVCKLKDLPIWVFHGEIDTVIPPVMNIEVVDALESCSTKVKITLYPDTGHDAWTPTYSNPAFYDWLLKQSK